MYFLDCKDVHCLQGARAGRCRNTRNSFLPVRRGFPGLPRSGSREMHYLLSHSVSDICEPHHTWHIVFVTSICRLKIEDQGLADELQLTWVWGQNILWGCNGCMIWATQALWRANFLLLTLHLFQLLVLSLEAWEEKIYHNRSWCYFLTLILRTNRVWIVRFNHNMQCISAELWLTLL